MMDVKIDVIMCQLLMIISTDLSFAIIAFSISHRSLILQILYDSIWDAGTTA